MIRDRDQAAVNREAQNYLTAHEKLYILANFDRLSTRNQRTLEAWIDFMQAHGQEVVLYLPPYHPIVDRYIDENPDLYGRVVEAEAYVRDLAARKKLQIAGSYDPARAGLAEADFVDGMHLKPEGVTKVLSGLVP
jgi:hypothetical protein